MITSLLKKKGSAPWDLNMFMKFANLQCGFTFDIIIAFTLQIQKVQNRKLWDRYCHRRCEVAEENANQPNERMLFHGSPFINAIVQKGFDERHAYIGGMFGAGEYSGYRSRLKSRIHLKQRLAEAERGRLGSCSVDSAANTSKCLIWYLEPIRWLSVH